MVSKAFDICADEVSKALRNALDLGQRTYVTLLPLLIQTYFLEIHLWSSKCVQCPLEQFLDMTGDAACRLASASQSFAEQSFVW